MEVFWLGSCLLAAAFGSAAGSPFVQTAVNTQFQSTRYSTPKVPDSQCPLVALKNNCEGQVSSCWSPGQQDVDCPNLGYCCFNGCVNVCLDAPQEVPPSVPDKPDCYIQYEEHGETIQMEDCTDVPGTETCIASTTHDCHTECALVDKPTTVTVVEECCVTDPQLVCEDENDCAGQDFANIEEIDVTCTNQQEACFDVPEQECHQEEVPECWPVDTEECKTVRKPVEWPTTRQECSTTYKEECRMVDKNVCSEKKKWRGDFSYADNVKALEQPLCQTRRVKECTQKPMESCQTVETVTLEEEDAQECKTVTTQKCTTKKVNKCEMKTRRECIPASGGCEPPVPGFVKTPVKKDCSVPNKVCRFEDKVTCSKKESKVEKWVPSRVCRTICNSGDGKRQCAPRQMTRKCSKFNKRMFYDIPVQKCSA